jgi:hypothetical protein
MVFLYFNNLKVCLSYFKIKKGKIMIYFHTIGDSTLDNFWWMLNQDGSNATEAKEASVEGLLEEKLNKNHTSSSHYEVVSHAYDGFTTSDVRWGGKVGEVLGIQEIQKGHSVSEKEIAYLRNRSIDPNSTSYWASPLHDLKTFASEKSDSTHYVVMSVGGNDFRERLLDPIGMLRDIPNIQSRYLEVLEEVNSLKDKNVRPILMFQYRVDANNDRPYRIYQILTVIGSIAMAIHLLSMAIITASVVLLAAHKISLFAGIAFAVIGTASLFLSSRIVPLKVIKGVLSGQEVGMTTLGALMETFYRPILAQAKKDNLPILDLPNTFNPYEDLYLAGIEPGKEGGKLIAEGIDYVVKNHDFESESMIYSKRNSDEEYSASKNSDPAAWRVDYPSKE